MATAAQVLPRPRTRSKTSRARRQPAAGRARFPEIYFVKHIDNSRVRREVDRSKSRDCLSLLGLGVLVFLLGFLFALQHFQCLRFGYQIEQLKAQKSATEEWNHQLRLEQASLADPQRIDTLARKKLGLASPQPQQVILLGRPAEAPAQGGRPEFARNFSAAGDASDEQ
jgi:cell division protein FtsL